MHAVGVAEMEPQHSEASSKKSRKPYTLTKARESWSNDEHERFIKALQLYNRDWKKIETYVGTKTVVQIRSHAQKYFQKIMKSGITDAIPPPRPKRRASDPPHGASSLHDAKHARLALDVPSQQGSGRDEDSDDGMQPHPSQAGHHAHRQQQQQQQQQHSKHHHELLDPPAQLEAARAAVSGQGLQHVYLLLALLFSQQQLDLPAMLQRLSTRDRHVLGMMLKSLIEELHHQQHTQQQTEHQQQQQQHTLLHDLHQQLDPEEHHHSEQQHQEEQTDIQVRYPVLQQQQQQQPEQQQPEHPNTSGPLAASANPVQDTLPATAADLGCTTALTLAAAVNAQGHAASASPAEVSAAGHLQPSLAGTESGVAEQQQLCQQAPTQQQREHVEAMQHADQPQPCQQGTCNTQECSPAAVAVTASHQREDNAVQHTNQQGPATAAVAATTSATTVACSQGQSLPAEVGDA